MRGSKARAIRAAIKKKHPGFKPELRLTYHKKYGTIKLVNYFNNMYRNIKRVAKNARLCKPLS